MCTFAVEKEQKKGTNIVPFSFILMATDSQIQQIEQLVEKLLSTETEFFCVHVRIKPTNNIKVFIDGDNGITIEKCVQLNRKLYKMIVEELLYTDGEFSLELSSPGVEEPLRMHRQYLKNKGRNVEVVFTDGSKKEGILQEVAEQDIIIEHTEGKGKKAVTQQLVIPFSNIKTTTVQIKF